MGYLQHPWASGKAGKIPLGTLYGYLDSPMPCGHLLLPSTKTCVSPRSWLYKGAWQSLGTYPSLWKQVFLNRSPLSSECILGVSLTLPIPESHSPDFNHGYV